MPNIARHSFSENIIKILQKHYGDYAEEIFNSSPLIGYLNTKTKSANRGSKARGSFANHYALYVVVEDYIKKGFYENKDKLSYSKYEGAKFIDLFNRQRELPFGSKLQNHAINSRFNDEFKKFYPTIGKQPIVRNLETQRYWLHEDLIQVTIRHKDGKDYIYNLAPAIIDIIDDYVSIKKAAFEVFIEACRQIAILGKQDPKQAIDFVNSQLQPNVDARIFEIVSYAVLKAKYATESIWVGKTKDSVLEETLILYKTGRTNANDGGIDFVMKPLGRFFQVTETTDVKKYFLDIDKVQRFPITFVIKSTDTVQQLREAIKQQAIEKYKIDAVVSSYMSAIEGIINVQDLTSYFNEVVNLGFLQQVMNEIVIQSKVEFNYTEEKEDIETEGEYD